MASIHVSAAKLLSDQITRRTKQCIQDSYICEIAIANDLKRMHWMDLVAGGRDNRRDYDNRGRNRDDRRRLPLPRTAVPWQRSASWQTPEADR